MTECRYRRSSRTRSVVIQEVYASLTERDGRHLFWYADRKQFVLGKCITDEMLAETRRRGDAVMGRCAKEEDI